MSLLVICYAFGRIQRLTQAHGPCPLRGPTNHILHPSRASTRGTQAYRAFRACLIFFQPPIPLRYPPSELYQASRALHCLRADSMVQAGRH
jgi:hypothetical protein